MKLNRVTEHVYANTEMKTGGNVGVVISPYRFALGGLTASKNNRRMTGTNPCHGRFDIIAPSGSTS